MGSSDVEMGILLVVIKATWIYVLLGSSTNTVHLGSIYTDWCFY